MCSNFGGRIIMSNVRFLLALILSAGIMWASQRWSLAATPMAPMDQIGPQTRGIDLKAYAHVVHVAPGAEHRTVGSALASIGDGSSTNRYAILVAAGSYDETRVQMKPHVDLYGGFSPTDWKDRDIYKHATPLSGQKNGPVVI